MLATDLYQLTMAAGYVAGGLHTRAAGTFELFVRRLPWNRRSYLVAAGLDRALMFLEDLALGDDEIAWLRDLPAFASAPVDFFAFLRGLRFTGDVWAMPEGTPFFAFEPIVRVTAPLAEAQYVETALLSIVNFESTIASKAARIVRAAAGRPVMEFGARRAHGLEAALFAARAAYLAGGDSTSYVEAGRRFGIPLAGTMAHSWVMAADDEMSAFRNYAALFGVRATLLLDTYDTIAAAQAVAASDLRPGAVRIDSGDLAAASGEVRRVLDAAGLRATKIVVSGDLDEFSIADLVARGARVDGFGVGTALVTSEDAPALGGVYKLVELRREGRVAAVRKRSPGKATWPGSKQVWRVMRDGVAHHDVVALEDEPPLDGAAPLLTPVMQRGRRVRPVSLADARTYCRSAVDALPSTLLDLGPAKPYPVDVSDRLRALISG